MGGGQEVGSNDINLLKPNDIYMSYRSTNLQTLHFQYLFNKIYILNILNMLHNLRFFSSKCHLFHNATFFGSCIIRNLPTECAKI